MTRLSARRLGGIPEVVPGDDLAELILQALGGESLREGEVVAIAHKVVSKAEGSVVSLAGVQPGARARELAAAITAEGAVGEKDPRVVQVVLDESAELLRSDRGVLVLLDNRITKMRYGQVFFDSLPDYGFTTSIDEVEQFFNV